MNWAWATSLDQVWRTPAFPMWVMLAAALAFALVLLVTLLRAEKSVANGALAVITLLAIVIAMAATARGFGSGGTDAPVEARAMPAPTGVAALSCLDGFAGDAVESACERALFASPDTVAAAVSYAADQISRLARYGDQAAADRVMTPELAALRRAVERDRYGLVAQVLSARDGCTPSECAFYKSLSDHNQIAAAMTDHTYAGLVGRYALSWANPAQAQAAAPASAPPPAVVGAVPPPGKPVSGDFPTAASIPPVNIMASEPAAKPAPRPATAAAQPSAPPAAAPKAAPKAAAHNANGAAPPAARKPAPKKPPAAAAPAGQTPQRDPLAPAAPRDDN